VFEALPNQKLVFNALVFVEHSHQQLNFINTKLPQIVGPSNTMDTAYDKDHLIYEYYRHHVC
jgi:hypothetical protein